MPPPPPRPKVAKVPFVNPAELYEKPAEVLVEWLRMRCADGVALGGSPGLVISGKSGCGKLTAVRWAMKQAGLDASALTVFHPWASESAAAVETAMVRLAETVPMGGVVVKGGTAGIAPSPPPTPYRVLVMKHAELWAVRASAREAGGAAAGVPAGASSSLSFAQWTQRIQRAAEGGRAAASACPQRVAIILLFPDMSLPRARHLVGVRKERGHEHGEGAQGEESAAEGGAASSRAWKHIELDHVLLMRLESTAERLAAAAGVRGDGARFPFDGDVRAFYRRLADSCRIRSPHKLDLSYNVFRATQRLLGPTSISMNDVRGAVEQDDRLPYMLWFHAVQAGAAASVDSLARDRAVWSSLDMPTGNNAGWDVVEWRLSRLSDPGLSMSSRGRLVGMTFEQPPRRKGIGRVRASPAPALDGGRIVEYGFRVVDEGPPGRRRFLRN
jgi:hypothetical protein